MMKNTFATLALMGTSLSGFAATQADLILKGSITPQLEISIQHEPLASTLDLTTQASNLKVATLTEKSNYNTGYKVKAKSTNAGKLVNSGDANSFVNYTLTYAGNNVPLTSSATQFYSTNNLRGTFSKELKISYNRPENLSAGSYEDVVQFTIEAN